MKADLNANGWSWVRLGDVADLQTGISKSPRVLADPVVRPYLRVANVQDGHVDLSEMKSIAVEQSHVSKYELQAGDVLMTEGGDFDKLGRGTVWRGQIPGCLHQNHVFAVRPHPDAILPEYLAAWTTSAGGRRYFKSCSKQTTNLASINSSQVRAARLRLPSIERQARVVEIARCLQTRIDAYESLLDAKRRLKRGLMQQLLSGRRRLGGFSAPWADDRLGALFTERIETGRDDLPLLSITGDRGVVARDEMERRDTSNADKSQYLRIAPGDIGYNTMRMWQGVSALSTLEGIVSPAYTICVPGSEIDGAYAATYFKYPPVVNLFRRSSQGLVDYTLNLKFHHFSRIHLKFPPLEEQRAIAKVFEAVASELVLLARLADALDRQKRALLDKLLSGELPIPAT